MAFIAKFASEGLDGLFSKVETLNKKIQAITQVTHTLDFDLDQSIVEKTQEMGGKVQTACGNMTKAVDKTSSATKAHSSAVKDNASTVDKATDAGKKHGSALDAIKGKYEGVTGSIGKLKTSLAGIASLLAGGAVAGIAWTASLDAASYKDSVMSRLSQRKGTQRVDTKALQDFVDKASDSGYTSTTNRLQLANLMINRGAKNGKYAAGASEALEKMYFRDMVMLEKDYGITSAEQLGEMATSKNIRGDMAKNLDYLFGKGFSSKSQSQRIKALNKIGVQVDIDAAMAGAPLDVIKQRFKNLTSSIGGELKGPMNSIAGLVADILGVIDKNPILPKIIAIGAGLVSVAGVLITIVGILPMLKSGFTSVGEGMKLLSGGSRLSSLTSMLMNPYVILIALAAIILVVAYKTGVLQKAWDKFTHSAIGGDIIGGIKSVYEWIDGLIDRFSKWYEDSGKNQLLSYFMIFVDILSNAWDYIDKIYSKVKATSGSSLLAGLAAMQSIPAALIGGAFKTLNGGKGVEDILGDLRTNIQSIHRWISSKISPVTDKIHEVMKKAANWLNWLYTLLQGMWNWLMNAIPGAKKESKRLEVVHLAEKRGIHLNANGELWLDKLAGGRGTPNSSEIGTKLQKAYGEWKALPGFAEGIADAVAKGLSGIGTTIASAITGAFPDFNFPDFTSLTKTLGDLVTAIANWNPLNWSDTSGGEYISSSYLPPGGKPGREQNYRYYPEKDKVVYIDFGLGDREGSEVAWDDLPQSVQDDFNSQKSSAGHSSGVSFTRSGWFGGKFHAPEEVIPQATASKGPGPISRALDILYGMDGKKSSTGLGSGVTDVHIHNENKFDFTGAKLDSKFDVEAFLRKIDARIETASVKAVKKELSQRRT